MRSSASGATIGFTVDRVTIHNHRGRPLHGLHLLWPRLRRHQEAARLAGGVYERLNQGLREDHCLADVRRGHRPPNTSRGRGLRGPGPIAYPFARPAARPRRRRRSRPPTRSPPSTPPLPRRPSCPPLGYGPSQIVLIVNGRLRRRAEKPADGAVESGSCALSSVRLPRPLGTAVHVRVPATGGYENPRVALGRGPSGPRPFRRQPPMPPPPGFDACPNPVAKGVRGTTRGGFRAGPS
jgi:hypothetical protein